MCCSALQCVVVCCSVLQCVAVCYIVQHLNSRHKRMLCLRFCVQHLHLVHDAFVAVFCNALQCIAVWCSVVQCRAVCCSALQRVAVCNTLIPDIIASFASDCACSTSISFVTRLAPSRRALLKSRADITRSAASSCLAFSRAFSASFSHCRIVSCMGKNTHVC